MSLCIDELGFMSAMSLPEAQLFRLLTSIFGEEKVIYNMRVISVCGGEIPQECIVGDPMLLHWSQSNRCLFTLLNGEDQPRLVIEFFSGYEASIVAVEAEHQRYLRPLFTKLGIHYVTISDEEFSDILDPNSGYDFFALLRDKVELQDPPV